MNQARHAAQFARKRLDQDDRIHRAGYLHRPQRKPRASRPVTTYDKLTSYEAWASRPRLKAWTAVALHHHVVPASTTEEPEIERPISLTLDAGELVSLAQAHKVSALIHGHQHLPFIGRISRTAEVTSGGASCTRKASVTILGGGSLGVSNERIPDELSVNTWSFYDPFALRGLRAKCFGFRQNRDLHEIWNVRL